MAKATKASAPKPAKGSKASAAKPAKAPKKPSKAAAAEEWRPEPPPNWEVTRSQPADAFAPYGPTSHFAKGDFLLHPKFGRGIVAEAEKTAIRVVFEDGMKKLAQSE